MFKPAGWENLSAEAKELVGSTTKVNAYTNLVSAISSDMQDAAIIIFEKYTIHDEDHGRVCDLAMAQGHFTLAKEMIHSWYRDFKSDRFYREAERLQRYFKNAAEHRSEDMWEHLSALSHKAYSSNRVEPEKALEIAVGAGWLWPLQQAAASRDFALIAASAAVDHSAETLRGVLEHYESWQLAPHLGDVLSKAIRCNAADMVDLLLAAGVAPADNSLGYALHNGAAEIAERLVAAGCSVERYARSAVKKEKEGVFTPLPLLAEKLAPFRAAFEREDQNARFKLMAPHTLAETMDLPAGGKLTMLFNFQTRQQILLVQEADRVCVPVPTNFSAVESREALAAAAEKFIELGGDAALARQALPKPKKLEMP